MSAPWLKFYPTDWRADPALRMCSVGARGLWMEMLCVMHEASPRGSLLVNGRPVNERQLAGLAGCALDEASSMLAELEEAGVFSRETDGTIFSRRMRRDDEKADRDKANGRKGGNPTLKSDKEGVNPPLNRADKAQKPEARDQNNHTAGADEGASEPRRTRADLDELEAVLVEAAGQLLDPTAPALSNLAPILNLIQHGCDVTLDVLPAIREVAARPSRGPPGKVRSWEFFTAAIRQAHDRRTAPLPPEVIHDRSRSRPTVRQPTTDERILAALAVEGVRRDDLRRAQGDDPFAAGTH
ncbi:hypothetical protein ACLBXM_17880 [Xanthobacteraceae bacterium A53D]